MTPEEDEDEQDKEPVPKKGKSSPVKGAKGMSVDADEDSPIQATFVEMGPVLPSTRSVLKSPRSNQGRHDVALRRSTLDVAHVRQ